jgi:hypothetical protein
LFLSLSLSLICCSFPTSAVAYIEVFAYDLLDLPSVVEKYRTDPLSIYKFEPQSYYTDLMLTLSEMNYIALPSIINIKSVKRGDCRLLLGDGWVRFGGEVNDYEISYIMVSSQEFAGGDFEDFPLRTGGKRDNHVVKVMDDILIRGSYKYETFDPNKKIGKQYDEKTKMIVEHPSHFTEEKYRGVDTVYDCYF